MKYLPWFQVVAKTVVYIIYAILFRVKVVGKENIPKEGCLVCANHISLNDPLFITIALGYKHEISSMGKKEMYDNKFLNVLLRAIGTFPVDRGNIDMTAIKNCLQAVKDGKKLVLFPEGTRNIESKGKAKAGIGLIAIKMQCPVVPVYVNANPKIFGKVTVTIGESIIPPKRAEKVPNEIFAQQVVDTIYTLG